MTRSHKLILASTFVAGGYAFALLLGSVGDWLWPNAGLRETAADEHVVRPALKSELRTTTNAIGGARLVPESAASQNKGATAAPAIPDPTWLVAAPPVFTTESSSPHSAGDASPDLNRRNSDSTIDSPSPWARITSVKSHRETPSKEGSPWDRWPRWDPNVTASTTEHDPVPSAAPVVAGFEQAAPLDTRAVQVSFEGSPEVHSQSLSGERQRSHELADTSDMRIHILVDGDSLAKLADRYLDDPELSDEIFRLNRDVLDDPELLPIGVELRIPDRQAVENRQAASLPIVQTTGTRAPVRLPPVDNWTGRSPANDRPELLAPERPTWAPAFGTNP